MTHDTETQGQIEDMTKVIFKITKEWRENLSKSTKDVISNHDVLALSIVLVGFISGSLKE